MYLTSLLVNPNCEASSKSPHRCLKSRYGAPWSCLRRILTPCLFIAKQKRVIFCLRKWMKFSASALVAKAKLYTFVLFVSTSKSSGMSVGKQDELIPQDVAGPFVAARPLIRWIHYANVERLLKLNHHKNSRQKSPCKQCKQPTQE